MATTHISANKEDVSNIVIMPGDPRRVKYIADKYLDNVKVINELRGELGVTGYYKNTRITIFSSGMGIPSMGIYSHELYKEYDVDTIIRIGSAGSYVKDLNVNDLYLVTSSYSDSNYAKDYMNSEEKIVNSDNNLNNTILKVAIDLNLNIQTGKCYSAEAFYTENLDTNKIVNDYNCKCVEMETYSLFTNAKKLNKKAACILTISDSFVTNDKLTSEEREKNLNNMIYLALETSVLLNK